MKIILLENLRKIGSIGEIINVKRGFARNYLIAKKKALYASKENIKEVEKIKSDLGKKDLEKKKEAKKTFETINGKIFSIKKLSTENNELYGSVKPTEISKIILESEKLELKPSMIQLENEISGIIDGTTVNNLGDKKKSKIKRKIKVETKPKAREILPTKTQAWQKVFNYLSTKSGVDLKFEPASSQLDFELKLAKGRFDLAYMSPVQFVNGNQAGSYKALAKRKSQPAKGLIVALKDGPIKSLRDFEGKVVAFPGLLNFSSSIIPRRSLEQLNIHVKPHFTGSHLQAMQLVLNGAVLGAAGTQASIALLSPPQKDKLTIVWDTPSFTPHAFARHTRVPFYSQIRLQNALVGLIKTEQGKRLLPTIHINNGFETATDSDWEDVESIDIDSLNTKRSYPLPSAEQKQTSSELQ